MFQQFVPQQLRLSEEWLRYGLDELEIGVHVPLGIFSSFLHLKTGCMAHSFFYRVSTVCSCVRVKAARAGRRPLISNNGIKYACGCTLLHSQDSVNYSYS